MTDHRDTDEVFWSRLEEMPALEAEHECVARREYACLQVAVLVTARAEAKRLRNAREHQRLGAAIGDMHAQITLLNERLAMLRRQMDRAKWSAAVKTVLGQEAYEQCREWIVANEKG